MTGAVEIRPGVVLDDDALAAFARQHFIRRLAVFGSALGPGFGTTSDLDLLVEFEPDHIPGLLTLAGMELELQALLGGREVELRTANDLSRFFRDAVKHEARPIFHAA